MTRLESEKNQRFEIVKETHEITTGLRSAPLSLRKHMVEEFDREHRWALAQETERKRNENLGNSSITGLAEYLANAGLLFREKEYELAQEFYKSVLKLDSSNELALRGQAECASALGQHQEAIRLLHNLTIRSASASNFKMLGDELYSMEYFQDAIQAYMQSLNLNLN